MAKKEPKGLKRTMMNECYRCSFSRGIPGDTHIKCIAPDTEMEGDEHGRKEGWFMYPFNFDPCWKTKDCRNYRALTPESGEPKEDLTAEEINSALNQLANAGNKDMLWCVMKRNGKSVILQTQLSPSAPWSEIETALSGAVTSIISTLKMKEAEEVGR